MRELGSKVLPKMSRSARAPQPFGMGSESMVLEPRPNSLT